MTEDEQQMLQRIIDEGNLIRVPASEQARELLVARRLADQKLVFLMSDSTNPELVNVGITPEGRAKLAALKQPQMTDQEMIQAMANAMGKGMNGRSANDTDRDFAARFLHAYRALMAIQRVER